MPKIGNSKSSSEMPCVRCGSKCRVAKVWTEKIKNDHGVMVLEHRDIICTNKECQKEFEEVQKKDMEKRAKLAALKLERFSKKPGAKTGPKIATA